MGSVGELEDGEIEKRSSIIGIAESKNYGSTETEKRLKQANLHSLKAIMAMMFINKYNARLVDAISFLKGHLNTGQKST